MDLAAVPGPCPGVPVPDEHALRRAHDAAVYANWAAFHVGVPGGFASYVYRYRDGDGGLLYVGMTSAAQRRAGWHWQTSDWWSWVASAQYERCHNRNEAFQLETRVRREEKPLFARVSGYAALIAELDREFMVNHVTGCCRCASLTSTSLAGSTVVESIQQDPSGWT